MRTSLYWIEIEGTLPTEQPNRVIKVAAGSNKSEAEAREEAERRLAWLRAKIQGERDLSETYEAEIREQVLESISHDAVITRNRYGAQVLNCETLPILDVDNPPSAWWQLFARRTEAWRLGQMEKALTSLADRYRLEGLGFRLYATIKGFRVIVVGREMSPNHSLARRLASSLNTDPLYWRLCLKQGCYRARLTPKPFRIKVPTIKVPFPPTPESISAVAAWEASIQDHAQRYSVCRFIRCFGHDRITPLVERHDLQTGAQTGRPLA
ncbi:MAG: hypothetical protein Q8O00_04470 [Holophaga sp.]|nr:hypothetical protein [Holophaga sp.]